MHRIEVVRGDITEQVVDAIVNAANPSLYGGGGVDGAIHAAGGPEILRECRHLREFVYLRGLPTGDAVATTAGRLPARHVIHTVGPRHWEHPDGGPDLLALCHQQSLAVADELGCTSIAFPAISCGIYGWQSRQAALVAVRAVRDYWREHPDSRLERVVFVLFNDEDQREFAQALAHADEDRRDVGDHHTAPRDVIR